ncbi:MAG TPA: 23S rRNA (adenine(2503)-C(2))-methyltransferase RlmN, partial [Rectinemataceae bacterium]
MDTAVYLSGLLPGEIAEAAGYSGGFRASQIYSWIVRGAACFEAMSNLPAAERDRLSGLFGSLRSSSVSAEMEDEDGSLKLQIRLRDGAAVECVLLEDIEGRKTACLSSQVGCTMGCAFCRTGSLGFLRDLGPDEIMEQFYFLKERRGFISNVVFMGMGEPLLNLGAVRKAIALLADPNGLGMSLRKITISTSGIVPGIRQLAHDGPKVRLAVSLTTADEALRSELMPVNRSWGLDELKAALADYQMLTGERITLEAVILAGKNDSPEAAKAMAAWAKPLKVQINIIPWNQVPGLAYSQPSRSR